MTVSDVVVLGTGLSGLVAALAAHAEGASVSLLEKAPTVGGSTALSGGVVWLPATRCAQEAGISDSVEDGIEYYLSLSHGLLDEDSIRTLVETGPEFVRWAEECTSLRFRLVEGYPDYHPENPGGRPKGGRSIEPELFAFEKLGSWASRVTPSWMDARMLLAETPLGGGSGVVDQEVLADRAAHDVRGLGQALVGPLLADCLARGIEPVTNARATDLVVDDGQVTGVTVELAGGAVTTFGARRGVIICTGGFEWDENLVRAFLRGPMTAPTTIPTCTGDGLRMAMRAGAMLGNMSEAWWMPCMKIDDSGHFGQPSFRLTLGERTVPGTIMVNGRGERFTNEASSYNAQGGAFHQFDPAQFRYANIPAWLVLDHAAFQRYGILAGGVIPGDDAPPWASRADTLEALAGDIGVPPTALATTVARFNQDVTEGRDTEFGRGESVYDWWNGDQTRPGAAATLGTVAEPPFYAVELHVGSLGTKGGPQTDRDGRVLDTRGVPIPGLYAAGNAMAGTTGMVYGGAGGTLGPAAVFGYRAGQHAGARRPRTPSSIIQRKVVR